MFLDFSKFDRCRILIVGDLMIDEYVWGEVERISPEAPVQVVAVNREDFTLGGSGNVAHNLVALGAKAFVSSVIGGGRNAHKLLARFKDLGMDTRGIVQDSRRPTTIKTRVIAAHQHVIRIDRETTAEIAPEIFSQIAEFSEQTIPAVDLVLISDYGKGLITRQLVARLADAARRYGKMVIADPKGLDFTKYAGVSLITPNKKEAAAASGVDIVDDATLAEAAQRLMTTTGLEHMLITCGKDGMVLFDKDQLPYKIKAEARQVYDVSGAGDTVLSVLGLAIAAGWPLKQAVELANTAAGIVVGKVGTATVSKRELSAALMHHGDKNLSKLVLDVEIENLSRDLKREGKRIVFTNGCFDLLHVGHIQLFSASRQLGDVLIVAIDDDESVRRLKGPGRPVIRAEERVRILSALDCVDYVTIFSSNTLDTILQAIQPAILTKGSDYQTKTVLGREIVERHGGQVVLIPVTEDVSSSRIINAIKSNNP
jgi:D-beta-D-heptose 7-phosphate kinase/D-beta-D-heptose 1-phosphate adenosyltransferase